MDRCLSVVTESEEETLRVGEAAGRLLEAGSVVALTGELGAGKTVFVRGVAAGLGIEDAPVSPTFVVMNEYGGGRLALYHFDLYRLGSAGELAALGVEEYFWGGGVCVVEWADRARELFPPHTLWVDIALPRDLSHGEGIITTRIITFRGDCGWLSLFRSTVGRALRTLKR